MAKKPPKKRPILEELVATLHSQPPGDLSPKLEGYAYRFTIYLPLLSQGREVFTDRHLVALDELFNKRFKGYSATTTEGHPPWYGSWIPAAGSALVDKHMLLVVYSAQVEEAKHFFQHLKWILQRKEVADQEVVVIEHLSVSLVKAVPLIAAGDTSASEQPEP